MTVCQPACSVLPSLVLRYLCCSGFLLLGALSSLCPAQITLDGSLGSRGALNGPHYTISDNMGQIRGPNLFHSFGQFNLSRGESATFTGPDTISNILSRVTGGSPSSIDGTIRSQIPGANVYLLNPNGVMFGPNASLDISGSFHVSTANVLRFSDGATFSAHLADKSTLTVAPPLAFGFLASHPAGITIQGSRLSVQQRQTFSVTGGDITMTASQVAAPSGRLALTSVAAPGDVQVEVIQGASRLMDNKPASLGSVMATDRAQVSVSGNPSGRILVEAGALTLTNGAILLAQTAGALPGGDILVRAQALTLRTGSGMIAFTAPGSAGDANNISVEAQTVTIREGSFIGQAVQGAGRSGNVTVTADTLVMDGIASGGVASQISSASVSGSTGDAGNVRVQARTVTLTNGAQITSATSGAGRGGTVTVIVQGALTLDGFGTAVAQGQTIVVPSTITASSQPGSTGDAGNVRVEAQTVALTKGAQIQIGTGGAGRGGNVTVMAQGAVTLDGFGGGC